MSADKKDTTPVEVVAIERGHCGEKVREEGERFTVQAWRLADGSTWFEPVDPPSAPAKSEPAKK